MKTKKKLNMNKRTKRSSTKNKRGGLLMISRDTDLINTHLCNLKPGSVKDKPGLEILTSIARSFQLNIATLGYLQQMYKNTDNKWFKFVIFNNNDDIYIYIIDGAKINKHSVCMLQGLLDVTKEAGEYAELREAFDNLMIFKNDNGSNMESMTPELKSRCLMLMDTIDQLINRDIACMPVMAAGSGSINPDNSICINNKSGHYKPTEFSMLKAKEIFETNTGGAVVFVKEKEDKDVLKARYGEDAENFSGICLSDI
jgi:hypothetical protein